MKIIIGKYSIFRQDRYNIVIEESTVNKKGEPYSRIIGHYGTLAAALARAADLTITSSDAQSLKDVLAEIERLHDMFKGVEEPKQNADKHPVSMDF